MDNHTSHIYISAIAITLMFLFVTGGIIVFIMLFRIRTVRHQMELQEAEASKKEELLQTKIEVQEQALQLVSMEIHDNVGQLLGMSKMMLSDAFRKERSLEEIENVIKQAEALLGQSIRDLRRLSHTFSGKMIEENGLVTSLERELSYVESLYRIPCRFIHPAEENLPALEANQILLLFRIAQEALQNVIKHAQASAIECCIDVFSHGFRLSIRDNGKGMDAGYSAAKAGMGLKSIRERAAMLNGKLEVATAEGKGTTIIVSVQTPMDVSGTAAISG